MIPEERRQYIRSEVDWPVDMITSRGVIEGEVKNISFGGAYIQCKEPPKEDETFELNVLIPEQDSYLMWASAETVWSKVYDSVDSLISYGLGARFIEVSDDFKLLFEDDKIELQYSPHTTKKSIESAQDYSHKNENLILTEDKKSEVKRAPLHRAKNPIISIGVGLLVLVILLVMLKSKNRSGQEVSQIGSLQAKVKQLEFNLLHEIQRIDERLERVGQEGKEITELSHRLDKLEAFISHEVIKTSEKAMETRYHQVRAGETLYRISRRYGLTVDELRRLNGLTLGAVIYPGQKLIVEPAE